MSRVLLIGGAGSLGANLLSSLPRQHEAIVIDPQPVTVARAMTHYRVSVLDRRAVGRVAQEIGGGWHVVFLAGLQTNELQSDLIHQSFEANVSSLVSAAAALAANACHVTFLSSVSVYGDSQDLPFRPDQAPTPSTPYGVFKAAAEGIAIGLFGALGVPTTVFRVTQVYGVRSADESLPHRLLRAIHSGRPLKLTCNPETLRHYVSIDDVIQLLGCQLRKPRSGVYNVAAQRPTRVGDMFQVAAKRCDFGTVLEDQLSEAGLGMVGWPATKNQWLDVSTTEHAFAWKASSDVCQWLGSSGPICPSLT